MGAPFKQKQLSTIESDMSVISKIKPRIDLLVQRSFSDSGNGRLMMSRGTQVHVESPEPIKFPKEITMDSNSTVDEHQVNCDESYSYLCDDINNLRDDIAQVKSRLGLANPSNVKESINRLNGLLKAKECIRDIHSVINELENDIERSIRLDCALLLKDDYFTSVHGNLQGCNHKPKIGTKNGKHYTKEPIETLVDLLRLRVFPQGTRQFLPFSLENYFKDFSTDQNKSTTHTMSHELLRLSSLSTFPRTIDISMIRLARAGFYHIGQSSETKCFSCGITYKDWTSGDDPMAVHRRLSPSCDIVRHNGQNILSTIDNEEMERTPTQSTSFSNNSVSRQPIITNNTGNSQNQSSHNSTTISSPNTGLSNDQTANTSDVTTNTPTTHQLSTERSNAISSNNERTIDEQTSNQYQHSNGYSALGINVEKPRYPTYAQLQVRISSYQGWPTYLDQTPRAMAMAGFLFAGYQDYTRCFFCGGGLRNWEAGDDPWVEHARWFPQCAFVKQNKGEKFIQTVLKKQKERESENSGNNGEHSQQTNSTNSAATNTTESSSNHTTTQDQLQSVAARSVLEMGYNKEQVLDVLRKINESRPGGTIISAVDIMNMLLKDDDDNPTQTATVAVVTQGTSRDEEQTGNTHDDNSIAGATAEIVTNGNNTKEETGHDLPDFTNDDTESLLEENRQLKDERLCKVCLDLDASIAFLPCGHIVCCRDCAPAMRKCPICRKYIKGTVKTFLV